MNLQILVIAYNRPKMLRNLYQSIRDQTGIQEIPSIFTQIDAGAATQDAVYDLATKYGSKYLQKENVGINRNSYEGMKFCFEELRSEWVLYLEEDLVLSPDALAFLRWCQSKSKILPNVGAYCLCNRAKDRPDPTLVRYGSRRFIGWGFMMHQSVWHAVAKNCWCNGSSMWDNRLANNLRSHGYFQVFPYLSRVTNVGRIGTHLTPAKYDELMKGQRAQTERRTYNYTLV